MLIACVYIPRFAVEVERQRSLVRTEPFVIVRGKLQRRDGTVNVVAESLQPLPVSGIAPAAHNFG